jgi:hypothetical protein
MSAHEEFEQLCALATTGDLEPEEFKKLGAHLYECATCRASYRDFHAIIERGLPVLDAGRAPAWAMRGFGIKRRFAARAIKEGLQLRTNRRQTRPWWILAPAAMTTLLLVVAADYGWNVYRTSQNRLTAAGNEIRALSHKVAELEQQLARQDAPVADIRLETPSVAPPPSGHDPELDTRLAELNSAREALLAERVRLEERASGLAAELEKVRADSQTARTEIERLQRNLRDSETAVALTNRDLESLRNLRATDALTLNQQRGRIDQMSAALREQTESLERDRDLLAADRNIRDLIGARDLHVFDVQDEGTPGKVRPLGGRVFYTKDTSLVFYAYDLQNKGNVSKVDFQVWGKREGRSQQPRSLGILYVDDSTQRRWVLKFEDPKVLAQIDEVFVTVEPRGGSRQPTGKPQLLVAALNEAPNHP